MIGPLATSFPCIQVKHDGDDGDCSHLGMLATPSWGLAPIKPAIGCKTRSAIFWTDHILLKPDVFHTLTCLKCSQKNDHTQLIDAAVARIAVQVVMFLIQEYLNEGIVAILRKVGVACHSASSSENIGRCHPQMHLHGGPLRQIVSDKTETYSCSSVWTLEWVPVLKGFRLTLLGLQT